MPFEARLPAVRGALPGVLGARWIERLARTECPSLTARRARRGERSGAPADPIVWVRASGANVEDADGNLFVDLTGGFGVAAIGHAHPEVAAAVADQAARLPHALGDVHPSDRKLELLEQLAALAPFEEARVILGQNGSDAIGAALKTAALATGRPGVLAFTPGYHGLTYGPLSACGYGPSFRAPFAAQLNPHVRFASYPGARSDVRHALEEVASLLEAPAPEAQIGAILVEPALGRGGVVFPPQGFLAGLSELARERGALLIADEIFTGFGRTGRRFRSEGVRVDLLCVGKALGGGLPISACVGRAEAMAAWGDPEGEALHTATFFGNPIACRAATVALGILERERLAERARALGGPLLAELTALAAKHAIVREARGEGLMLGLELTDGALTLRLVRALLEEGFLTLPAGPKAEVLQLAPPLIIAEAQLEAFLAALDRCLGRLAP